MPAALQTALSDSPFRPDNPGPSDAFGLVRPPSLAVAMWHHPSPQSRKWKVSIGTASLLVHVLLLPHLSAL